MECIKSANSGVLIEKCKVKLISQKHLLLDFAITINRSLRAVFVHFRLFHKSSSNEFRPMLVNAWEDYCAYMTGDQRNMIIGRLYPTFLPYTNMNHTCPYQPGRYFAKISNISLSTFDPIQMFPSGRYRFVIGVHEVFNGPLLAKFRFHGSISDHRITIF